MSKTLIDRIDETREYWTSALETCRNELLDTIRLQNPLVRLIVEFDYLLVEARTALKAKDAAVNEWANIISDDKSLNERIAQKILDHDSLTLLRPDIASEIEEVALLERALHKRLRQEYMNEDHRLGGIGITYEEFVGQALKELNGL